MLCRSHPLRVANPQRSSAVLVSRALTRGLCFDKWFPAMRNCVSNGVRTSRCRTVFSLSPSKRPRTSPLSKSVCNRVCALSYRAVHRRSSGVSVIYRILPAPGFHRWERPSLCPQPDLNRHTKALAIELQGHVRLAVFTTIVIICEGYRARSHRQVAALPSGTAHRSCTFAAPLLAERSALAVLTCQAKFAAGYAANKMPVFPGCQL